MNISDEAIGTLTPNIMQLNIPQAAIFEPQPGTFTAIPMNTNDTLEMNSIHFHIGEFKTSPFHGDVLCLNPLDTYGVSLYTCHLTKGRASSLYISRLERTIFTDFCRTNLPKHLLQLQEAMLFKRA